ncbi:hypothetical protein DFH09DRAFT_1077064 [Mycena vulgaris]|nr:hypothetical protein DFH09DRAFT_1077060 [Mycena vulgaris]KAJ6580159.1 hypothetical protein DFH09DRAFT_1077064 [Mycena vulgaris]
MSLTRIQKLAANRRGIRSQKWKPRIQLCANADVHAMVSGAAPGRKWWSTGVESTLRMRRAKYLREVERCRVLGIVAQRAAWWGSGCAAKTERRQLEARPSRSSCRHYTSRKTGDGRIWMDAGESSTSSRAVSRDSEGGPPRHWGTLRVSELDAGEGESIYLDADKGHELVEHLEDRLPSQNAATALAGGRDAYGYDEVYPAIGVSG